MRIQHKEMKALAEKERENLGKLGEYNEYSRPKPSLDQPLRSVFLDPKVNNIPRSKTRSELMKRIKMTGNPHGSYDIDGM